MRLCAPKPLRILLWLRGILLCLHSNERMSYPHGINPISFGGLRLISASKSVLGTAFVSPGTAIEYNSRARDDLGQLEDSTYSTSIHGQIGSITLHQRTASWHPVGSHRVVVPVSGDWLAPSDFGLRSSEELAATVSTVSLSAPIPVSLAVEGKLKTIKARIVSQYDILQNGLVL